MNNITGRDVALSSFSGYMAFSSGVVGKGIKALAETGKDIARATIAGKVLL